MLARGGQQQQQQVNRNVDPCFKDAGKRPGLWIWRVENFELKKLPDNEVGVFSNGDSYLVMKAEGKAAPYKCHIHFWLGKSTSQDEAGTAALKAVELDDILGGSATQHREIQHHEGQLFLSYFKGKARYKEGGVRSGFKEVSAEVAKKTLLQVKGRKRARIFPVPLHCDSLNHGDVFILDNGSKIWVWLGNEANKSEKRKALEVARDIRDNERAGKAFIITVDDDPNFLPRNASSSQKHETLRLFYTELGTYTRIKAASESAPDDRVERDIMQKTVLSRASEASGQMRVTEIAKGRLSHKALDPDGVYILDQGGFQIFVWNGRKESKDEKLQRFKLGVNYCRSKGYPDYTKVEMLSRGFETSTFKQCFVDWPHEQLTSFENQKTYSAGQGIAKITQTKFDAINLHEKRKREDAKMIDDGSGKVDVFRTENFKLVPQPRELKGTFFGGDCYVILYTYQKNKKENYVIYYWLGLNSTQDEKGAAAILAVKMDDSLGGAPIQIRVVQGKEPPHFLKIFKGELIIYRGGKASGFRGHQEEVQQSGNPRLFQVRGNTTGKKALEVEAVAASLNSNDVFVLTIPLKGFLWYGKGCSGDERELAKTLASKVAPRYSDDFEIMPESQETDEFWKYLGGKGEYASGMMYEEEIPDFEPRLFLCSNANGRFEVEEICNFTQEDMEADDVMLIDMHSSVFVWVGIEANVTEKSEAMKTALDYLKKDPAGRDMHKVQVMVVKQGYEPPQLTGLFPGWNDEVFAQGKSYEEIKNELNDQNAGITLVTEELRKFSFDIKYPYNVLTRPVLPDGVDPTKKEYYLSPEEFEEVFSMNWDTYEDLPTWKQNELKKQKSLF